MNPKQLTTSELLMKEMSEIRSNQLAKQLIDEQKDVDASNNISFVIAKILPLVKPMEQQQEVYKLLVEASASHTANQAKLSAAVKRVSQLTEQVQELESLAEPVELDAESFEEITEEQAVGYTQIGEELVHEPS